MQGKIVAVANQKGGVGKTTLTMSLAGALCEEGYDVCVVDADPQGSAVRWAAAAEDETPFPAQVLSLADAGRKVGREVRRLAGKHDVTIVDCPPNIDSPVPASALAVADLALLPVIPSPPDLWASVGIRDVVEQVSAMRDEDNELIARLVVNMAQPNTSVTQEVEEVLSELDLEQMPNVELCLRTAYRQCAGFGTHPLVHRPRDPKAVDEVLLLVDAVEKLLQLKGGR